MTLGSLTVHNFKRFVEQSFRLAPLTILTGLNSSGKSTAIQALLLAHQAQGRHEGSQVPLNADPGLALGQPVDVLALEAPDSRIRIEITADGQEHRWTFESQFDGAEVAAHAIVVVSSDAGLDPLYLGAERVGPRTSQEVAPIGGDGVETRVELGADGRFVAHALAAYGRRNVLPELRHSSRPRSATLAAQTEAWMSELVGPVQFEAALVPRTDLATLHVRSTGTDDWFLPTNVGFGISYALPIVVAGLTASSGRQLIVDSPEAHLHPAAQSAVGAFLAQVASCGVQVIVETHSDHVLNGIRRSVVEQRVAGADVVIHFLAGSEQPATIDIDARGRLGSWPPGFFDQLETDLHQINRPTR